MVIKKVPLDKVEDALYEAINQKEVIERSANLSYSGSNISVRLPKEISDYLNINKKNHSKKKIRFRIEETNKELKLSFEIIDRGEK